MSVIKSDYNNYARLDNMESIETITLPMSDYQRLLEIAMAADQYLLLQNAESLEALKDAVLVRVQLID